MNPRDMTPIRLWTLMLAILIASVGAFGVKAQPTGGVTGKTPGIGGVGNRGPAMSVRFGYADSQIFWPSRWAPVYVTLTAPAGNGAADKPFDGILQVQYLQDGAILARVVRPVACTPGKTVTFPVMVNMTRGEADFVVTLMDRQGREVAKQNYSATTVGGRTSMAISNLTGSDRGVAWGVGEKDGPARSLVYATNLVQGESAFGHSPVHCVTGEPGDLLTSWTGYDSLVLLAVDADVLGRADPRVVAAIRDWVTAGGRLVVFANRPGREWEGTLNSMLLAGTGGSGEPVLSIDDPIVAPASAELEAVFAAPVTVLQSQRARAFENFGEVYDDGSGATPVAPPAPPTPPAAPTAGTPGAVSVEEAEATGAIEIVTVPGADASTNPDGTGTPSTPPAPSAPPPKPTAQLSQRVIALSDSAIGAGWRIRWVPGASDAVPTSSATNRRGLLAEGRVGFGWVVVVGFDPKDAAESPSDQSTRAVWAGITDTALADWRGRIIVDSAGRPKNNRNLYQYQPSMSIAGDVGNTARVAVLNRLAAVPMIGHAMFVALGVGLLVLAVMIGPFDSLVLRKLRARQHSWATGLTWITIAAVLAYVLPAMLRSGPTRVNRVSVVDVAAPAERASGTGTASGTAGRPAPIAWATGYTGVYAAATTLSGLNTPERSAGTWWRGASSQSYYMYYRSRNSSAPINHFAQMLPDFSSLAEGGATATNSPGAGGNILLPGDFKVWTFRMFMDQAKVEWPIEASFASPTGQAGDIELRLAALPQGTSVIQGAVHVNGLWYEVSAIPNASEAAPAPVVTLPLKQASTNACELAWSGATRRSAVLTAGKQPNVMANPYGNPTDQIVRTPGILFDLPGSDRRTSVIEATSDTASGLATVYLHLRGMPTGVSFEGNAIYLHDTFARILIPMTAESARLFPPAPPTSPAATTTTPASSPSENAPTEEGETP